VRRRARRLAGAVASALLLATPSPADAEVVFHVATRVPRPAYADDFLRTPSVTMSEGWACASFDSERGRIHQCWDASPHPRAFTAPWMKDAVNVARDHWCEQAAGSSTFRCWQRPRRGDTGPRELPPAWQRLNPNDAGWNDLRKHGDRLQDVIFGGTFACLRPIETTGVFCLGDDRFGQLGSGAPSRPPSSAGEPTFVGGLFREVKPVLGTWHACAVAEPGQMDGSGSIVCWGRGDAGQLGAPAPDTCNVDGTTVACARRPVRGPRVKDLMAVLGAGDLFTCVTSIDGTKCWGASRDGLFGAPGSCPENLRRAWPTPDGPAPAPKASCTGKPVTLPGATEFDPYFQVAPREIRYAGRVLSALPEPRDPKLGRAWVSPGSDASWCASRGAGVVCWGERYSPPGAPTELVPVVFEPMPSLGDLAVLEGPRAGADATAGAKKNCQVQRPCPHPVQKLPTCEGDNDRGRPVSEILAKAQSLAGGVVRVRGALGVGALVPRPFSGIVGSNTRCDPTVSCCKWFETSALVGGPNAALALEHLGCGGDESRACCNVPAYGQTVIATGVLVREQPEWTGATVGWRLVNGSVCEVRNGR
jgi:hypothetical protein